VKHETPGTAALRGLLARQPGNQTDLATIMRYLDISRLRAWQLCNEATREGWALWNQFETTVLYIP